MYINIESPKATSQACSIVSYYVYNIESLRIEILSFFGKYDNFILASHVINSKNAVN